MRSLRVAAERLLSSPLSKHWPLRPILDRLRRRARTRRLAASRLTREQALARYGHTSAGELLQHLRKLGIEPGCVVFCQLSLNDLHTFEQGPREVLAMLLELVGPEGTLAMPAYTAPAAIPQSVFDPCRAATYTGLVNEIFRRTDGVLRSAHPRHSVCARGTTARFLTAGHEHCIRADGPDSPFDRLRSLPGAIILTLGLPPGYISFLHWVEDIDPDRFPRRLYKPEPMKLPVRLPSGENIIVTDWIRREEVTARLDCSRVARRLSKAAMRFDTFKGIAIGVYRVETLAAELIALRDVGIIHYH
jgi:aminoglycoside N3'-acetyltransferase